MYSHREGDLRLPTFVFYIRTEITLFACSPPTQLFCADILGYGNIFLCGCDFGYHVDKQRFTSWDFDEKGNWQEHVHLFDKEKEKEDLIICNNGLYTHPVHLYYKKNMLSAWRLCCKTIYSTDKGIMTEIPYVDMEKVFKKQGYKFEQQTVNFIANASENYLVGVGAFIIETDKGLSFIESASPWVELPQFMQGVNRRYACNTCHIRLNADNDNPKTEDLKCKNCLAGTLIKEATIDIEGNMRRIIARLDKLPKQTKPLIHINMLKEATN
jgi:DNA-directed RNA polymerase subunit RPC12/RpoP